MVGGQATCSVFIPGVGKALEGGSTADLSTQEQPDSMHLPIHSSLSSVPASLECWLTRQAL